MSNFQKEDPRIGLLFDSLQWLFKCKQLELRSQVNNIVKASVSVWQESHKSIGNAIISDRVHISRN